MIKLFDYLIHLPNKIFFPFFKKNKKLYQEFQKLGYISSQNSLQNTQLASEISKKLKKLNIEEIINSQIKKNMNCYSVNIMKYLDEEIQKKIFYFFNNNHKIFDVGSMLGHKVKLRNVSLVVNFFNDNTNKDDGAKMFHRDSDSLQDQIKIFMLINEIDKNNGMLHFIPQNIINGNSKLPFEKDRLSMDLRNKWRNYDNTILSFSRSKGHDEAIHSLKGFAGELLYIDTGKLYHKGGYISDKNKKRFLLVAVYTPIISLSNWNKTNNKIIKFFQNKLTTLRIKLRKTLSLQNL